MIDWTHIAENGLWILGCALALACLSYASWQASISGEKMIARLAKPGVQVALDLAGLLFSAGLATTASSALQAGVFALFGALFLVQGISILLRQRASH